MAREKWIFYLLRPTYHSTRSFINSKHGVTELVKHTGYRALFSIQDVVEVELLQMCSIQDRLDLRVRPCQVNYPLFGHRHPFVQFSKYYGFTPEYKRTHFVSENVKDCNIITLISHEILVML